MKGGIKILSGCENNNCNSYDYGVVQSCSCCFSKSTTPPEPSGGGICDCCFNGMKDLLEKIQALSPPVAITKIVIESNGIDATSNQIDGFPFDGMVEVSQSGSKTRVIPICRIVAIEIDAVIPLLAPPVPDERTGECECCIKPIREYLGSIVDSGTVDIETVGNGGSFGETGAIVKAVGDGVVRIEENNGKTEYISLCKITAIDE